MATKMTTAGLNVRATSLSTDFPYIQVRNASGVDILTNRINVTDGTRITIGTASNGSIVWTIILTGSDCASLPAVSHDIQLFAGSTGGAVLATIVADIDKSMTSLGDKITQTFTHTES